MFATATITPGLDADGMAPDERRQFDAAKAARVLQSIIRRVPLSIRIGDWRICDSVAHLAAGIEVMLSYDTDHAKRAHVMALSEQFGLEYAETPRSDGQNTVAASGFYQGVPLKFWQLVSPCDCGCAVTSC